ncbi:MAG TPA: CDP-diacylglycerol diphosphatase [Mycobacterium sp.]|nr:CDP-diacylglycerol diphosphatase [Mycobacterium sp.]
MGVLGRVAAFVVMAAIAGCAAPPASADSDPDVLWRVVSEQCVPGQRQSLDPAPCAAVDLAQGEDRGYVVYKDYRGATQYLLIPTARVTGVEDPALLRPGAPNYFAEAWRARFFTEAAAGGTLPADWVSLAVNPAVARSQNQLHIHIDCLRADVHGAIAQFGDGIGTTWAPFPVPLAGYRYDAVAVDDLDAVNPFVAALADGGDPGLSTLAVVGAGTGQSPGFVILRSRADPAAGVLPAAEQLQDHTGCPAPLPPGPFTGK